MSIFDEGFTMTKPKKNDVETGVATGVKTVGGDVKSIKLAENIDNGSSSSDQLRTSISPAGFNNRDDCVRYNIFNPIVLWLMYIGIDVNDIVLKYFSTE